MLASRLCTSVVPVANRDAREHWVVLVVLEVELAVSTPSLR
jgi:hypothetical protein